MQNQVYKLVEYTRDGDINLEFWVSDTNEVSPVYKETKEVAITLQSPKGEQYDYCLDEDSTESLIKYLQDSLEFIKKFNKK